jgi:anti-sigma-K factor RskA
MIDESRQDLATLYVLGQLPPDEAARFIAEMERDAELRDFVTRLESATAAVAHAAPLQKPPADLKDRVLGAVRRDSRIVAMPKRASFPWFPWALAACAAVAAVFFWQKRVLSESLVQKLEADAARTAQRLIAADVRISALETEAGGTAKLLASKETLIAELQAKTKSQEDLIVELRRRDAFSSLRIAGLSAKIALYEKALAVVVYDSQQQRGMVELHRMPHVAEGKDLQLWAIDGSTGVPVSAGILPPGKDGVVRASFKPDRAIAKIDAFAVSIEPAGGSVQPRGEVVLVGQ